MIVYHYTTKSSLDRITSSGQFAPSNPWTTMDSAYGNGWYFTDLSPNTCDVALAYYCWRRTDVLNRVRYYLKFNIDDSILEECRQHVYMVSSWDANLIRHVGSYQKKNAL
jgi:hypothetical protein